jgi:hypothetical protein
MATIMKLIVFLVTMLPLYGIAQTEPDDIQPRRYQMYVCRSYTKIIDGRTYVGDAMVLQTVVEDSASVALRRAEAIKPLLPRVPGMVCFNRADLNAMPVTSVRDVVALAPAIYQRQRGANAYMAGGQNEDILYVVDGMHIPRN